MPEKMTVVALAQQTYGVRPSDLQIRANAQNATEVTAAAQDSAGVRALFSRLADGGIQPGRPVAQKITVPLSSRRPADNPVLDWVRWELLGGGEQIGQAYRVVGSADERVFAIVPGVDRSTAFTYIQNGQLARTVIEANGTVRESTVPTEVDLGQFADAEPKAASCEEVCGIICHGGLGATIPGCMAGCLETGPGDPFCAALCAIIVELGCLLGCDDICGLV